MSDSGEKMTKKVLLDYLKLDNRIRLLENQNVGMIFRDLLKQLEGIKQSIQVQQKKYEECCKATGAEKADVDKLLEERTKQGIAINQQALANDADYNKEQTEYTEALNAQLSAESDLNNLKKRQVKIEDQIKELEEPAKELDKLKQEQDDFLNKLFKGNYGSDLENKLENELDMTIERRKRVSCAQFKWSNSKVLLQHAKCQLQFAVDRWEHMMKEHKMEQKYRAACETRNNLIAARQNIVSCHKYLDGITFPYCNEVEMQTLERALTNIFNDMSADRCGYAHTCYDTTNKRAQALLQWFDNVLNLIDTDFVEVEGIEKELERQLRQERVRLMKKKAEEDGVIIDLDDAAAAGEGSQQKVVDLKGPEVSGEQKPDVKQIQVDQKDIVGLPNKKELFGDMEKIKQEYAENMQNLEKHEQSNKARQRRGLDEKLEARRRRHRENTSIS